MKKEFHVLRGRPTVTIRLTRDSVSAGDDVEAPHEREVESYSFLDPVALVNHLRSGYLPSSSDSWDCLLNGEVIATINFGGITPKVPEVEYADANHLHFAGRPWSCSGSCGLSSRG